MRPLGFDEFFRIKYFKYETYLTLKVNQSTEEPIDAEEIMKAYCENTNNIDKDLFSILKLFLEKKLRSMMKLKSLLRMKT